MESADLSLNCTQATKKEESFFDPLIRFKEHFKLEGDILLEACPICASSNFHMVWQLPQSRLEQDAYLQSPGSPADGTYLRYMPLLQIPQNIFRFDICEQCYALFRNPTENDHKVYAQDTSKIRSLLKRGLTPFRSAAQRLAAKFPSDMKLLVDAACGAGEILALIKEDFPALNLMGLELSEPSVNYIQEELQIPAARVDLDLESLDPIIPPGSADFVVFNEAFEHVRYPLQVLKKLLRLLRPGGRLYFTAQFYGPNSHLQIRTGEPIFISAYTKDWILNQLPCSLVDYEEDIKMRFILEKT